MLGFRMSKPKSEKYFREQSGILYRQGNSLEYIANLFSCDTDTVWEWIQKEIGKDLYVDFDGIWKLVHKNYFGDCQELAREIGKRVKLVDGMRETVFEPNRRNKQ